MATTASSFVPVETITPAHGLPVSRGAGAKMARLYGSRGEPGGPCRCLWCGDKLPAPPAAKIKAQPALAGRRGGFADNAFCGLDCGYSFGLEMAVLGKRLRVSA